MAVKKAKEIMKFIQQLYQLGLFNPKKIYLLGKAKKLHGNNICFLLKFSSEYYATKIAISDGEQSLNFLDLYRRVSRLSVAISKKIGFAKKPVAILVSSNSIANVLLFYAIQNAGIKLVLVNQKTHQKELQKIIDAQTLPCFIFTTEKMAIDNGIAIAIDELAENDEADDSVFVNSKKSTPVIFTTSGTTGASKLIEKRKGAFYWLRPFADLITYTGIHKRKAVYISIPISHGFGCTALLFALILGKKAVLTEGKNWQQQVRIIIAEEVDLVTGVPASLYHLAENIKNKKHKIGLVISGGAALSAQALQMITDNFTKNIYSMYGSTEASTSFIASYRELEKNSCALGRPLKNVTYKLAAMPEGGNELLINSSLANIEKSSGWIYTGDMVMIDENKLLLWCGRRDDMIIKNGVNIYPIEIENFLSKMPEIEDSFVGKEKHPVKGEIIIAFIKLFINDSLTDTEIKQRLLLVLPAFKVPDRIEFVTAFDYTSTGKKIKPSFL